MPNSPSNYLQNDGKQILLDFTGILCMNGFKLSCKQLGRLPSLFKILETSFKLKTIPLVLLQKLMSCCLMFNIAVFSSTSNGQRSLLEVLHWTYIQSVFIVSPLLCLNLLTIYDRKVDLIFWRFFGKLPLNHHAIHPSLYFLVKK